METDFVTQNEWKVGEKTKITCTTTVKVISINVALLIQIVVEGTEPRTMTAIPYGL